MKKISLIVVLFFVISSVFSQNYKDFKTTKSGLKYKITKSNKKGELPSVGDKVVVHYVGKLTNDTVFDSSIKRGKPFTFELGAGRVIKGWDEGIALLKKGEKATLVIPPELGYGDKAVGNIPPNSTLIFDVELIDIIKAIKIEPFDVKGKDTVVTESGLKYIVSESKNKKHKNHIEKGSRVTVNYTGYLSDGKMFDSSIKRNQPFTFEIGEGRVIKGWDIGVSLMSIGDKFRLIIPYGLAYGEKGRPPIIPEKATLVFDVELLNIQPAIKVEPFDVKGKDTLTTESGLKYIIVRKTKGIQATAGKTVKVDYSGYLQDGTMFDSSVKRGKPIEFQVGVGRVIKGWDEALQLMSIGDKFRIIIPYNLAYGERGVPPTIPPKATLIFDVQLESVK